MMNSYIELKNRQQAEVNAFPLGFAFSNEQFAKMMAKWGLTEHDTDKICSIGMGGYVRISVSEAMLEMFDRLEKERQEAIANDKTGDGYIYEMFAYELANHEYGYTRELEDTLDALGLNEKEVYADSRLYKGLRKAIEAYDED